MGWMGTGVSGLVGCVKVFPVGRDDGSCVKAG